MRPLCFQFSPPLIFFPWKAGLVKCLRAAFGEDRGSSVPWTLALVSAVVTQPVIAPFPSSKVLLCFLFFFSLFNNSVYKFWSLGVRVTKNSMRHLLI